MTHRQPWFFGMADGGGKISRKGYLLIGLTRADGLESSDI
jgi:hypothetical protein